MKQEKIILPEDAEKLIQQVNLEVWKVDEKNYFVKKEQAIKFLTTHKNCECGNLMEKSRTKCPSCWTLESENLSNLRYEKKPYKEWNGEDMLYLHNSENIFFSDEEDVLEYLEELNEERDDDEKLKLEDLQLCICTPNTAPLIDYYSLCEDILPEDEDDLRNLNPELMKKIDELNEFIKTQKPITWGEGPFRTTLKEQ